MNRFWNLLLGIPPSSPGNVAEGGGRLEFGAWPQGVGAVAAVLGALIAIALVYRIYRRERLRSEFPGWVRAVLVGLRLLTLATVGLMLLEPLLVFTRREEIPSRLALIFDDSESMGFSDPYTDESKAAEAAAGLRLESADGKSPVQRLRETPRLTLAQKALGESLEALSQGRDLFTYDLATAATPGARESARDRKLGEIAPNRPVSALGDALRGVLAAHRGQPVAGLVLVSDGRSNGGEDPLRAADEAARRNIPIFAVAAGGDEGPRNVRLAEVEADPVVFARDPMTVGVVVESRGLRDAEASIVLEQRMNEGDWEPAGNQRIALGEDGVLKRSTFRITPGAAGDYEFRARVEDAGPELTMDDNEASASVRVVRQRIRVLFVAGGPSPEAQFLRNALMRDQHVEYAGWLQHADPGYRQAGDRPITRLPSTDEELNQYDALLLVDPDLRAMGPQWPAMIEKFVGREGGGLIYVAGELFSQQLFESVDPRAPGGDWTRVLPVVRDPGLYQSEAQARLSSRDTYSLELTPEGRGDPIFEFHADPLRNRAILTSLPGMYWSFPVTRARPGATVLARHGDPRMSNQHGRRALLASQFYGPGRSVYLGFDATYRWRYLSEDYFDGFWARLVDRAGRGKALGGRFPFTVHLGKDVYRVGDRVSIGVRYSDPQALAEAAELAAELESPGGEPPEPIHFAKSLEDPALLSAEFPAHKAGSHALRIVPAASGDSGGVRVSTTTFRVESPRREIDEPTLNRALLTDLARRTGGRVFELSEIDKLDQAIPTREVIRTLENREELWNAPLLYGAIIMSLTLEWVLRKLYRMS